MKKINIIEILQNEYISCEKEAIRSNKKLNDQVITFLELERNSKILLRSVYLDPKYYFELELESRSLQEYQSNSYLKIQLHKHLTSTGLLRVEYGLTARHTNPKIFKEGMPEFLRNYTKFTCEEGVPHIHLFLENFVDEELLWAIPLSDIQNIRIESITTEEDEISAIKEFFRFVHIITEFNLNPEIFSVN